MILIKFVEKMIAYFSEIAILLLGIGALVLLAIIWNEEGLRGVWNTLSTDVVGIFIKFLPVITIFFLITGSLNHLQKSHPKKFRDIIAGKEGTAKMIALAASLPGPAGGKQLQDAWNSPGADRSKILLCLVGMMALGVNIFIFRAKVLGGPLTLIWACMAFSLLFQVWLVCKFKPWTWFS